MNTTPATNATPSPAAVYGCGHKSRLADYRRGKARAEVIARVAARPCPVCAASNLAARLTRIDGTPYTEAEKAAYVAKRTPRVY